MNDKRFDILPNKIIINHRIYNLKIIEMDGLYIGFYYNKKKTKEYYLGRKIFRNENIEKVISELYFFITMNYNYKNFEI